MKYLKRSSVKLGKVIAVINWLRELIKPKCKYHKVCKSYHKSLPYCAHDGWYRELQCGIKRDWEKTRETKSNASLELLLVAFMLAPQVYQPNLCELAAKDFHREFGGEIIFANPYDVNHRYILGPYKGHWFNLEVINGQLYYIDYLNQRIIPFEDKEELQRHLDDRVFGLPFDMWIITAGERPPFNLNEHY